MLNEKIKFILDGSEVKRFHTIKVVGEETVGHHSFLVSMLCYLLNPSCSKALLLAALAHDLPEGKVGDIPSPTKDLLGSRSFNAVETELLEEFSLDYEKGLSEEEQRTLKLADRLAGLIFCRRQLKMGNSLVLECHKNYYDLVQTMEPFSEDEIKIINVIIML